MHEGTYGPHHIPLGQPVIPIPANPMLKELAVLCIELPKLLLQLGM